MAILNLYTSSFSDMKSFLSHSIIFVLILVALNYPISSFIANHFYTYNKQTWILEQKEKRYDYVALGSSRIFNMFDAGTFNAYSGYTGLNIGTSGSNYAENYIVFSEFIKNNKISTLILNLDEFSLNASKSFSYPFHDFEFLPLFNQYRSVFYDYLPEWKYYLWKVLPVAKYCEYNSKYTLKRPLNFSLNQTLGTQLESENTGKTGSLQAKLRLDINSISPLDEKYLNAIVNLCQKNQIKLVLITMPIYNDSLNNFVLTFLKNRKNLETVSYIDYRELIDVSDKNLFKDYTHTNSKGSIAYSRELGKKLRLKL